MTSPLRLPSIVKAVLSAFGGCVDCGESDPVVLDFDHRDETLKEFQISGGGGTWRRGLAGTLLEIEKCDLRCARCHRLRTASRQYPEVAAAMRTLAAAVDTTRAPLEVIHEVLGARRRSVARTTRFDGGSRAFGGRPHRWTSETQRRLRELLGQGLSMRRIAREGLVRGRGGAPLSLGTLKAMYRVRRGPPLVYTVKRALVASELDLAAARRTQARRIPA
jgi:hypothetical protein